MCGSLCWNAFWYPLPANVYPHIYLCLFKFFSVLLIFRVRNSLFGLVVHGDCPMHCRMFAASLASTHWSDASIPPIHDNKNGSKLCQISHGGQIYPQLRMTTLEFIANIISLLREDLHPKITWFLSPIILKSAYPICLLVLFVKLRTNKIMEWILIFISCINCFNCYNVSSREEVTFADGSALCS